MFVYLFLGFRVLICSILDRILGLVGIEGWNEFDGEYAFVYKKPVKGSTSKVKKVLVKCLVMNGKLLVVAIAEDGEEPAHLQIEYVIVSLMFAWISR